MTAQFTLALLGVLGLAAPAMPQDVRVPCSLCTPNSELPDDKPANPVKLDVEVNLDFDRLVLTGVGDGSAELGPDGARNATGSITAISARAMVGEVMIRGEPDRYVRIELPRQIELHGYSGGVIRLESLRSDLPQMPRLDGTGRLKFRVGGVLHVTGDLSGAFRGDVPIDVDYL
ncbi:DUF4402 domain-containing protein [Sphingomonas sp. RB56-2]|uniref:DUF4402 domain-containing protein n=1 Tax=Sphingomonas brevis TaxID=2908206 RepID=A0ABT0SBV8_9SPHN|nr:DUF4402 domain-containing protein [Sphingomonas brevis]MCL6741622.1 DUF4402 domain-containing protein [Sphingomonas brevis]